MLITTAHQRCLTSLAVSDKRIPEWLSVICSLQNWGLVCWEATSGVKSGVLCHSSSVLLCTGDALESKSRQQLDRCLAATVWAARHHSNGPTHHSLSPLAAWNHTSAPAPGDTDWNRATCSNTYQKPVRDVNELKQHVIETRSATSRASLIKRLITGKIVLMRVSKPKANTEHLLWSVSA